MEQEKIQLLETMNNFNIVKNSKDYYKIKKNHIKKQNKLLKVDSQINKKQKTKEIIIIIFFILFALVCMSNLLFIKAEINESTHKLNEITGKCDVIESQNQVLETNLLNNVDGMSYMDYIHNVLGMSKSKSNQITYISVENYKKTQENEGNNSD